MACLGAALGLRCTVRGLAATGQSRRNWLLTASSAIGTGIWTMHFIAMLGFRVSGTEIRYNVPLTVISLLVAMAVVGAGVFAVGYGRGRPYALVLGGVTTGLGVSSMHYLGLAALRLHGTVHYDLWLVALYVLIAVAAATVALRAALNIHAPAAVAIASLVMGAAVSSMHYTGMTVVSVDVAPFARELPGATATQFIFPPRRRPRLLSLSHLPLRRPLALREGGRRHTGRRPPPGEPQECGLMTVTRPRRSRTVRARIVCLLMVPVVSLLGLWAFATVSTAQDISRMRLDQRADSAPRAPSPRPPTPCSARGGPPAAIRPTPPRVAPRLLDPSE
jgi:NO-binding membrane sensor protein with MHYT domain